MIGRVNVGVNQRTCLRLDSNLLLSLSTMEGWLYLECKSTRLAEKQEKQALFKQLSDRDSLPIRCHSNLFSS